MCSIPVICAYQLALGRHPLDHERELAREFLERQQEQYSGDNAPRQAWTDFCQVLLSMNGFVYVE